jgi:hypothetical protein
MYWKCHEHELQAPPFHLQRTHATASGALLTKQAICRNMQELQMQLANMHNAKLALSDGV